MLLERDLREKRLVARANKLAREDTDEKDRLGILVFLRGESQVGIPASQGGEIARLRGGYTPLPAMPPHIAGVFNLRGNIFPLVDPSPLLGLSGGGQLRLVLMAESPNGQFGIGFDGLMGLVDVDPSEVHQVLGERVIRWIFRGMPIMDPSRISP